jgi:hypothetical protein
MPQSTKTDRTELIPDPSRIRLPRALRAAAGMGTADLSSAPFGEGYAWQNGVAQSIVVSLTGCLRWRLRWLSAAAGTVSFKFLRPTGNAADVYLANNPPDMVIVGGTENKTDIDPCFGEAFLLITFTPSSTAAHNYSDISETWSTT